MLFFSWFKKKEDKEIEKWDDVMKWCLRGLVFLIPVFYLSVNAYQVEFNKVLLFNILVFALLCFYILKIVIWKRVSFDKSRINWIVMALLGAAFVSFIFSGSRYLSLVGLSGYYGNSLITVASFIIFGFLVYTYSRSLRDIYWILGAFLASAGLVTIYSIFKVNGVALLPGQATKGLNFYLASSASGAVAVFIAVVVCLATGFYLLSKVQWQRILSLALVVIGVILLFFLDKHIALFSLAMSAFIFLLITAARSRQLPSRWVIWPTVLVGIAIAIIFLNTQAIIDVQVSETILLDNKTSASIAWQSFLDSPIWGSGLQTFNLDFIEHRPEFFNNSLFWNLSFIKAANEWWGLLSTAGILGLAAWLGIYAWVFFRAYSRFFKEKPVDDTWRLTVVIFISWLVLGMASCLMPFNFILYFIWWLLLALNIRLLMPEKVKVKQLEIKKTNSRIIIVLVFSASLVACVLLIFFGLRVWLGDYHFVKAQQAIAGQREISEIENHLTNALRYNPYEPDYYISQAQGYATQAQLAALEPEFELEQVQQLTQSALDSFREAKNRLGENFYIYQQEAALYDSMRNLISNADELSMAAYAKAAELSPNHPMIRLNLGRSRLLQAQVALIQGADEASQLQARELLDMALEDFLLAKQLKSDFVLADLNLGYVYETLGDFAKALQSYNSYLIQVPDSVETLSHIANIYKLQGLTAEVITTLERAQEISPDNVQVVNELEYLRQSAETAEEGDENDADL